LPHKHEHSHNSISKISSIIQKSALIDKVKKDILSVYDLIVAAESKIHGKDYTFHGDLEDIGKSDVVLHEVGEMDAIADISAVCLAINAIAPDLIYASPITTGFGFLDCTHGTLPIPAPATAEILKNIPTTAGEIESEHCTPTGAALLKHFVQKFIASPEMVVKTIGYGMGQKEFPILNAVRAFIAQPSTKYSNNVTEITCNIDDMNGEDIGYVSEILFEKGALDVFTTQVIMKKSRPGVAFTCICPEARKQEFAELILKHTTTFGVRMREFERITLEREITEHDTPYGKVRLKRGYLKGYNIDKIKAEYQDIAKLATQNNVTIEEIKSSLPIRV
jgi:uncharacterized protein (TIGR00299 family) protein